MPWVHPSRGEALASPPRRLIRVPESRADGICHHFRRHGVKQDAETIRREGPPCLRRRDAFHLPQDGTIFYLSSGIRHRFCPCFCPGGLYLQVEFGKHALVADPQRPEAFATMLSMPMQYPRLREILVVEGARFARRVFGWTGIARRTLRIFDQFEG